MAAATWVPPDLSETHFEVPVSGGNLSGERRGEGEPIVLVHGMAGDRHEWDRLWNAFRADSELVRYDLRGFGKSSAEEGVPFSHSEDLLALFDAQGIERATVLGLSMGGGVALNFALNHPERVSRLILISSAMVGWEWSEDWKSLWHGVANAARSGDMALARERWWMHPMFAATRANDAAAELRRGIEAYHGRHWIRDDQRDELPDLDRLHELAMPTLLLTGEQDVPDIRLMADLMEAAAPDVTRIDYPGAGHMLYLERTQDVTRAVAEFARPENS